MPMESVSEIGNEIRYSSILLLLLLVTHEKLPQTLLASHFIGCTAVSFTQKPYSHPYCTLKQEPVQ